jgi:hypothetical protein
MPTFPTSLGRFNRWLHGPLAASSVPASAVTGDVFDLIDAGLLDLHASGAGIDAVRIALRLRTKNWCGVEIPVGTRFAAEDGKWQNMIAIAPFRIELRDGKWHQGAVLVACLNSTRATPTRECRFRVERPCADDDVGRLIRALGEQKVDPVHWQQHIWRGAAPRTEPKPKPAEPRRLSA